MGVLGLGQTALHAFYFGVIFPLVMEIPGQLAQPRLSFCDALSIRHRAQGTFWVSSVSDAICKDQGAFFAFSCLEHLQPSLYCPAHVLCYAWLQWDIWFLTSAKKKHVSPRIYRYVLTSGTSSHFPLFSSHNWRTLSHHILSNLLHLPPTLVSNFQSIYLAFGQRKEKSVLPIHTYSPMLCLMGTMSTVSSTLGPASSSFLENVLF